MSRVYFALREFCEVHALRTIKQFCSESGIRYEWVVILFSVNTDFRYRSLRDAFRDDAEVTVIETPGVQTLSNIAPFGFATDMHHDLDVHLREQFSVYDGLSCRFRKRPECIERLTDTVVVGNVKITSPVEDFQREIFDRLAGLPHTVIVVPRHPLSEEEVRHVEIPTPVQFINTMGQLDELYARATIAIMGRVFCADGLKPDDDHNPLEPTVNSHAVCGINNKIPPAYEWLYKESGLLHVCASIEEVFQGIDDWMDDVDLEERIQARTRWVMANKEKHLRPIMEIIEKTR